MAAERLNIFEAQLDRTAQITESKPALQNEAVTFAEKRWKLAGKKKSIKKQRSKGASSPDAEIKNLIQYYKDGQHSNAEKLQYLSLKNFLSIHLPGKFWEPYLIKSD